jgi:hypothetical protein
LVKTVTENKKWLNQIQTPDEPTFPITILVQARKVMPGARALSRQPKIEVTKSSKLLTHFLLVLQPSVNHGEEGRIPNRRSRGICLETAANYNITNKRRQPKLPAFQALRAS